MGHWLLSSMIRSTLLTLTYNKMDLTFSNLSEDKKRNVVTYVVQIIVTSFALILQLYGGKDVLFHMEDATTPGRMNNMILSLSLVSTLYIWELVYREKIGLPLLVHHLVTLLLIQTSAASFLDTWNILYVRYALLLGFHATTEQSSFVALFCFRLQVLRKSQATMFYFASAQAFLIKTAVSLLMVALVIKDLYVDKKLDDDPTNWNWYWKVLTLPLVSALYGSQCYASWVLFSIGKKCAERDSLDAAEDMYPTESVCMYADLPSEAIDGYENSVGESIFKRSPSSLSFQAAASIVQAQLKSENDAEENRYEDEQDETTSTVEDSGDGTRVRPSSFLTNSLATTIDIEPIIEEQDGGV